MSLYNIFQRAQYYDIDKISEEIKDQKDMIDHKSSKRDKKDKKRKRTKEENSLSPDKLKKKTKHEKKEKKEKRKRKEKKKENAIGKSKTLNDEKGINTIYAGKNDVIKNSRTEGKMKKEKQEATNINEKNHNLPFDHKYILAPMVGASELAFRLLCRKYGAHIAYTPMMSSTKFAVDQSYRKTEFQTIPEDRPLVCHFSANDPNEFAAAAKLVEDKCDAIDLNLGCPQRTAYVGHFGSYLLGNDDRELILSIIRAGCNAVSIPIFVKIRLLDTLEETITLCQQLRDAGASLIAIHARFRASFERNGPGARDGPALLDQVREIKKVITDIPIISNGNIITYEDVVKNLEFTEADGVMSAEGILDNPALFLPRLGNDGKIDIEIADPSPLPESNPSESLEKKERKLSKKLREITKIEEKMKVSGKDCLNSDQQEKIRSKQVIQTELHSLQKQLQMAKNGSQTENCPQKVTICLEDLMKVAENKIEMANEYLSLARKYPVVIRSVVFHTRRICKELLNKYQLMEKCIGCETIDEVQSVLDRIKKYIQDPLSFNFDKEKDKREKEALAKKKREEGKRKSYEARMMRKAKREGKTDMEFYLRQGAEVPTVELIKKLKALRKDQQLNEWKEKHGQHCMAYHLNIGGCQRDRTCAFLHVDAKNKNSFIETDEVAG